MLEAEDRDYPTASARLELTSSGHTLVFDVGDAGLLWVVVREGAVAYDCRCALRIGLDSGVPEP